MVRWKDEKYSISDQQENLIMLLLSARGGTPNFARQTYITGKCAMWGGYILFKASCLAYGAGGAGSRAASTFYARPPRVVGPSPHVVVYHRSIFALIVFLRPLAPLGAALCW